MQSSRNSFDETAVWMQMCVFISWKMRKERDGSRRSLVPKAGFEPARVTPHAPQTCVSTRFHHFGTDIYATTKIEGFSSRMAVDCNNP